MKRLPMRKIREALRLRADGFSTRHVAQSLSLGRATISGYYQRFETAGLSWPLPDDLSDRDLEQVLYPRASEEQRGMFPHPDWLYVHAELRRKGVTLEIVEDRYEAGSTLITSQMPVDTWHDVIGDPTFADAILDRLVHNAYRVDLDGQSMRKTKTKTGDNIDEN